MKIAIIYGKYTEEIDMKICPLCQKKYFVDEDRGETICNMCNSWLVEEESFIKSKKWHQFGTRESYDGFERRKDPRLRIRFPIKVCFELLLSGYPEGLSPAYAHDIGGGGVLFESDQYAPVSTIIETHITLQGEHEVLRTLAKVINVRYQHGLYKTTTAFLRIDAVHRAKINRFVEEKYRDWNKNTKLTLQDLRV